MQTQKVWTGLRVAFFAATFCALAAAGLSTVTAQQAPVKIGVVLPLSGDLEDLGRPVKQAAELAASHINEQGGLLGGRRLELVFVDDATDAAVALAEARRLVEQEDVSAIITGSSDSTLRVAAGVSVPNRIVHLSLASSDLISRLDDDDYVFRVVPTDAHQGVAMAELARNLGYSQVAVFYVDNDYGRSLVRYFSENFQRLGGRVSASAAFAMGRPTYREELEQLAASGAEALVLIGYPVTGITIVRDALTHGYFDKFIFGDSLAAPALIEPFGNALDGSFGVAAVSDEWPGFKEIQQDYAERYGEPAQIAFFQGMYDAVFLLALAMEQAGETSGPAVREALRQVTGPSEAYVVPGDWAGAVRLIRDGTRIQYRGNPMHLGFDENGDPVLGTVGLWTVVDGRLTVFASQALRAEMIPGTGEPVKVGVLLPLTGELAAFGAALKPVAEFAASHVNVQGGLLDGRRLEVVVADDGTDPETAVAAARRLVEEEGVSALVTISSDVALRVATEVSVPSRVLHVTLATSPVIAELDDDDYVFRAAVSDRQQAAALAMLADRLGHSRLAVMYVNNAYGQGLAQHFAQEFTQRGGQVTAQVAFEPGRASYREEVAEAAAQGAQALVLIAYPESGAVIVDEALAGGHFRKFLFADALQAPEFVAAFGRALDGSWGTSVSSRPEGTAYLRQEFARFPGAAGFVPLFHEMYDAIFLIAMAMEKAGTTSGPAVRDAIRRLSDYGQREVFPGAWTKAAELIRAGEPVWYAGQPGRLGFDGHGDPAIARVGVWTVRDGQIQAVGEVEAP